MLINAFYYEQTFQIKILKYMINYKISGEKGSPSKIVWNLQFLFENLAVRIEKFDVDT